MPYDQNLAERLRAVLAEHGPFTEKKMFGGLCFLKDSKMVFAANRTGDLMVRVDPARCSEYTGRGAVGAKMGRDRSMSPGWLVVPIALLQDDAQLRYWTDEALAHHARLT